MAGNNSEAPQTSEDCKKESDINWVNINYYSSVYNYCHQKT